MTGNLGHFRSYERAFFKGLVLCLAGICSFACGGGGITFPQGPTSGADDLSMTIPQTSIQATPSFKLVASFNDTNSTFTLTWEAPPHPRCISYHLLLVKSPTMPDPGNVMTRTIAAPIDTTQTTYTTDQAFFETVQNSTVPTSALILCVSQEGSDHLVPSIRSNFEDLNLLMLSSSDI